MIMSNKQMLDFYETDRLSFEQRGVKAVTCVQTAGDVMIIPESWGHGVLNIQESVAVATESPHLMFRSMAAGKPPTPPTPPIKDSSPSFTDEISSALFILAYGIIIVLIFVVAFACTRGAPAAGGGSKYKTRTSRGTFSISSSRPSVSAFTTSAYSASTSTSVGKKVI